MTQTHHPTIDACFFRLFLHSNQEGQEPTIKVSPEFRTTAWQG